MPPIGALNVYVNGFHFYNGNMSAQMEAHHYCSILNEDLKQCIETMTMDPGLGHDDTPYVEADRAAAAADGLHFELAAQRTGSTCPSPINASFSPAVPQLQ